MMMPKCFVVLAALIGFQLPLVSQNFSVVPGSTEPRIQLTGENFQIYSNGLYFTDAVPGRTMSRYGLLGTDLGYPVTYPDKIVLLFGDTMAVSASSNALRGQQGMGNRKRQMPPPGNMQGPFLERPTNLDAPNDSIGYIPNTDLSQCHYIAQVQQQLQKGNAHPTVPTGSCPAIQFYENPRHGPADHAFMNTIISGLQSGEGLGNFRTPSGAFDYNGSLYMFYITKIQEGKPHLALMSIMAKADQPHSQWSNNHPPTFHRLYTVSTHPEVADVGNAPPEEGGAGKFMFNPLVVLDAPTITSAGLNKGLPPALQKAAQVVFVFGSSWKYNRSNLYLAAFNASDVEAGTSKWFYFTGQKAGTNTWSNDEKESAPLLVGSPNVGNHSVVWNAAMHSFVLMYGNILAATSPAPWGPWSAPIVVLGPNDNWETALIHHSGQDPIVRSTVPIHGPVNGQVLDISKDTRGVAYGPYLFNQSTTNSDGSVTVYFTMSTWNPYEVYLVSTTFKSQ
jgi:hypothetical protein